MPIGVTLEVEPTYATWEIDDNVNTPQWAIIREIDWKVVPNEAGEEDDQLVFYYSNFTPDVQIRSKQDFIDLLTDVCRPDYQFTGGGPSEPKDPYGTKLSLDSRKRWSYVIFKLASRPWQFARKGYPLKFGDAGTMAKLYFNGRRVNEAGVEDKGDDPTNLRDDCMVAYFISDARNIPIQYPYPHAFNLHVDLKFDGGAGHMPVIMDPDVRHPGGSLEGP